MNSPNNSARRSQSTYRTANRWFWPRITMMPSDAAGVAIKGSPIRLTDSNSYFGPALITNTSPSSLEKYSRPADAIGEALNVLLVVPMRYW